MNRTILYSFILSLLIISCEPQQSKEIIVEQSNPTEYVFHFQLDIVKAAIVKSLDHYQFQSAVGKDNYDSDKGKIVRYECLLVETYNKNAPSILPDQVKIFSKPENYNDVYLYTYGYSLSQVYYSDNCKDPLIFSANYDLHLDSLDEKTTKVTVHSINFRVMTGKELFPSIQMCGFGRSVIIKQVPNTTVEQYEILLQIGNSLGEVNMPKIVIPKKICLTRTGKLKL